MNSAGKSKQFRGGIRRLIGMILNAVIIRTTWDYQQSPDKFLEVLRQIDGQKHGWKIR